jgi:hypothetical protein
LANEIDFQHLNLKMSRLGYGIYPLIREKRNAVVKIKASDYLMG